MSMTPGEETMVKVGTIWLPLGVAISVAGTLVWFTWTAQQERLTIHNRIEAQTSRIDNVVASIDSLTKTVDKIVTRIGQPDTDSISRQQWLIECLQLQILNPGWKCPYGAQPPGVLNGSSIARWATTITDWNRRE